MRHLLISFLFLLSFAALTKLPAKGNKPVAKKSFQATLFSTTGISINNEQGFKTCDARLEPKYKKKRAKCIETQRCYLNSPCSPVFYGSTYKNSFFYKRSFKFALTQYIRQRGPPFA
jgi:hypothetical protein